MFENLDVFRKASMMARHSAARQSVVSENVANANTPGYRARDVMALEALSKPDGAPMEMLRTRSGHQSLFDHQYQASKVFDDDAIPSPDGNSVSIENEILKSVEAERSHSRAMAIYQSNLNIIRTSIGRGR